MAMSPIDELVETVGRAASLSPDQATLAVSSMLRFLGARLPSPVFGELQAHLNAQAGAVSHAPTGEPPLRP